MNNHLSQCVNITAYKFVTLDNIFQRYIFFKNFFKNLNLLGTIILSVEGINFSLAGCISEIDIFLMWLRKDINFKDIVVKTSYFKTQPFNRILVKLKPEIITMKNLCIQPEKKRAPSISAVVLKHWLDQGKDIAMIDIRNTFEIKFGTFKNALNCKILKFSEFQMAILKYKNMLHNKTIVIFCTGGIRCEKAAIYMQNIGYNNLYQLEGGILQYFKEIGGAHYQGNCFIFDNRVILNVELQEL